MHRAFDEIADDEIGMRNSVPVKRRTRRHNTLSHVQEFVRR